MKQVKMKMKILKLKIVKLVLEVGARELGVDDTDMANKDSMFICFGSCLSELLNTKIPEGCKCNNKLEMIDFKYIGTALKMGKIFFDEKSFPNWSILKV